MKLYLGIIYKKGYDNKYHVINHRSVLKILVNPLLRKLGYFINSKYDDVKGRITGLELLKLDSKYKIDLVDQYKRAFCYNFNPNTMKITKERIWF